VVKSGLVHGLCDFVAKGRTLRNLQIPLKINFVRAHWLALYEVPQNDGR
jgi:hypothetical protein